MVKWGFPKQYTVMKENNPRMKVEVWGLQPGRRGGKSHSTPLWNVNSTQRTVLCTSHVLNSNLRRVHGLRSFFFFMPILQVRKPKYRVLSNLPKITELVDAEGQIWLEATWVRSLRFEPVPYSLSTSIIPEMDGIRLYRGFGNIELLFTYSQFEVKARKKGFPMFVPYLNVPWLSS